MNNNTNHHHQPTPILLTPLTASMVLGSVLAVPLFGYLPLAMTVGGLITLSVLAKKLNV